MQRPESPMAFSYISPPSIYQEEPWFCPCCLKILWDASEYSHSPQSNPVGPQGIAHHYRVLTMKLKWPCKIIPKWVETGNADQLLACRQLLSIKSPVVEKGVESAYGFPVFSSFLAILHLLCSAKSFLGLFNKVISDHSGSQQTLDVDSETIFFPTLKLFSQILQRVNLPFMFRFWVVKTGLHIFKRITTVAGYYTSGSRKKYTNYP